MAKAVEKEIKDTINVEQMIDEMAKTIIKKCTEFIFTNQSNERFDLAKS